MKNSIPFLKSIFFAAILLLSHEAVADWRLQTEPPSIPLNISTQAVDLSETSLDLEQAGGDLAVGSDSLQQSMATMGLPLVDPDGDIVAALADQLEYNWSLIYQYVQNRIKTDPYVGLIRSPERTLLDGTGSPMEQAHLFVELIRSFAPSQYTGYGEVLNWTVPVQSDTEFDICDLTGTSNYTNAIEVLRAGGMVLSEPNPLLPTSQVTLYRVLAGVMLSGNWYYFEPAFKSHTPAGQIDFRQEMGYSRTQLLSAAGGSGNGDWVSGLDEGGITNLLDTWSSNLLDAFHTNGISIEEAWPLSRIIEEDGTIFNGGAPPQSNPWVLQPAYNGKLVLDGNALGVLELNTYETAHEKISIRFESGTYKAQIYVDDVLKRTESTGGSFGADFALSVSFIQAGTTNAAVYNLKRGSQYVLCQSFGGGCGGGMADHIGKTIDGLKQQGFSDSSPEVFTESLRYTGQRWMDQISTATEAIELLHGVTQAIKYQFGIMAGESEGFYIDVKQQHKFGSVDESRFSLTDSFVGSAMEHAVLEQLQHGNALGVSTLRIFNHANADGMKIYRADSSNWSSVEGNLVGYDTSAIGTAINQGAVFVLPESNSVTIAEWSGEGYVEYRAGQSISMKIGGDYDGGYNAWTNPYVPEIQQTYSQANQVPAVVNNWTPSSTDPVDMQTGAFTFEHTDLAMDGPMPLALHRSYRSDVIEDSGMVRGWSHSFGIRIVEHSAIDQALGQRSGEDLVPFLAGMGVVQDLLDNESTAKDWAVASLVADWTTRQLTQNAVSVYLGGKVLTFIRQSDGSYTPPPGMTVSLSRTNGVYVMQKRHEDRYEFDANLNLAEIEDQYGNTLTFAYDAQTNLQTVTSSFGPQFTFGYTGDLLTSVTDNSSPARTVQYQYDSDDNLTNFVDAAGFGWGAAYGDTDLPHAITSLTDPEGIVTIQNTYNDFGQVIQQTSANGQLYSLYITGYQSTERDPLGNETTYKYDARGRTVEHQMADGNSKKTIYDGWNRVVASINEAGVTNVFVYDIDHNLLAQTNAWGTSDEVVACYGYDAEHHLRFATNAVGTAEQTVTEYTYTATHHVDTITEAKSTAVERTTDLDYFSNGLLEKKTEGNGKRVTDYTYDGNGNPDTVASTDAGTIDYLYNIRGDMKSMTVDEKTTAFGYDARRLPTAITNALGSADQVVVTKTYYDNGLLKTATDGRGNAMQHYWTPAYKQAGIVFPDTGTTTNLYDEADRLVHFRDAEGNWTTNTLDAVGRSVYAASAHSTLASQYNAVGNITNSAVDPSGLNLWTATEYDALNRPLVIQNSLFDVRYLYDSLGRATNRTDAASKNWKTEFDELGRVKKSYRPSNNYEEYGYDDLGNRTHFWNAEYKPMTFGVDGQGRVTSITNAVGKVTAFVYDDAGNLSQRTAADLKETDYGYDSLNRLVAITNEGVEVATFDHDANGNLVGQTSLSAQSSFGYDGMNRLVASTQAVASAISIVGYQYDLNGNRTHVTYPGGTNAVYVYGADNRLESVDLSAFGIASDIGFNYDSANRLTNIVYPNGIGSEFGYDDNGNITSIKHGTSVDRTIQRNVLGFKQTELIDAGLKPIAPENQRSIKTHNDADQLVSEQVQTDVTNWTAVAYSYSANGCLTNVSQASPPALSYAYDYNNRLKSVDDASSVVEYIYDAGGARVGRIHNSATNYFVIDYADGLKRPLAETDSSGTITRYYVWSGMRLLCHIEANGDVFYYHSDELGSTLALTDGSGTLTDQFAYMPYGYANHSGSTSTPFQWLGGYGVYYDVDTDLHLTLHRAYSCSLKRFLHPDPMGIDGGVNVYAWANLNPLFFVDPYGLCAESFGDKFYGAVDQWGTSVNDTLQKYIGDPMWNWGTGVNEWTSENVADPVYDWGTDVNEWLDDRSTGEKVAIAFAPAVIPAVATYAPTVYAAAQNQIYRWGASTTLSSPILYETLNNPNPIRPSNFEILSSPAVQNAASFFGGYTSGYVPGPPSPVSSGWGGAGFVWGALDSPYE